MKIKKIEAGIEVSVRQVSVRQVSVRQLSRG